MKTIRTFLTAFVIGVLLAPLPAVASGIAAAAPAATAPATAPAPASAPAPAPAAPAAAPAVGSQFGGCVRNGTVCFSPSAAVTPLAINLSTGKIEAKLTPVLGYGFTVNPGQWSSFGADGYFSVDPSTQQADVTFLAKFVNGYLRIGVSKSLIGDRAWRIPIAFGVDL